MSNRVKRSFRLILKTLRVWLRRPCVALFLEVNELIGAYADQEDLEKAMEWLAIAKRLQLVPDVPSLG